MNIKGNVSALCAALLALTAVTPANAQAKPETRESQMVNARRNTEKGVDFSAFARKDLTPEQLDYLTFLYAYMPLPDVADHNSDFFLDNVDVALTARREMPWGKDVPEREFRHFVVPLRINDEPLDGHRRIFYDELKDRVKNLTAEEAILEVNHWCHEKATYQPADGRTHSPLQTVYTAIGRCGEESTFTVAALRAIGIPARQVYTPRWAHTDDNHAWVEAYANGKWYFLGACEPEPVLNLGWFNAPASRGMLMNTRVLGQYRGPEEILLDLPAYTDINVTSNYAPTSTVAVDVVNSDGTPADSARVDFCLYNYGEFYPLTPRTFRKADNKPVTFEAGRGDLLVWASDGHNFGFTKYTVGKDERISVVLDKTPGSLPAEALDFTIVPPKGGSNMPALTTEEIELNNQRKQQEDMIRGAYTATFVTPEQAAELAAQLGVDAERLTKVLTDARGNHKPLTDFLSGIEPAGRERALRLLEVISMKDRSDADPRILADHLNAAGEASSALFDEYVLNPRVDNEQLSPFRSMFLSQFAPDQAKTFAEAPAMWVEWVADNIVTVEDWYPVRVRMSPKAVMETRRANRRSKEIFFVTGARTFGIPSRIDPISGKTQWADGNGAWHDVDFGSTEKSSVQDTCQGMLKLGFTPAGRIDDPKYYSQFTISKIVDGRPQLLGYDDFAPWSTTFAEPQPLDCGDYMLVTGQRMADGSVLSRVNFFEIAGGQTTPVQMTLRQDSTGVQVIGSLDAEHRYMANGESEPRSILSTTGRGYYILGILNPTHEPSVHAIVDLAAIASEIDVAGRPMVLLAESDTELERLNTAIASKTMPKLTTGQDIDGKILGQLVESLKLEPSTLPVFVVADTFNRVVFVSQGYTIGLGEKLLDVLHKIEQ